MYIVSNYKVPCYLLMHLVTRYESILGDRMSSDYTWLEY